MNETALELQLFENLKPELTSFCYRMLGSIDDADDAVQETFIRVWQSWHSFRQDSSFKTWVYRIASNLCLDKLRQAKRRTRPVDLSDPAVLIVELREKFPDSAWIGLPLISRGVRKIFSFAKIPLNSVLLHSYRSYPPVNVRFLF
ncbi:sigma-70 family RNA polymerase sigma factor [Bacillus sp. V2I10]|uniref:sigma-70 family RNA polymerase sigma factor n=1 Tax=Bacillus sp. V2I10 TaxID=3042276 RepID=UPI00278B5926|nr:sigma-70 family RNA polymerase sigma factor [Bacillus sp. V2I10]MDQ0858205.1 RNA polymerase sigma factor (sigma-70 family) [Bacillus sp. V2I10]